MAVAQVVPDTAAARAGLRPGDRVLEADGIALSGADLPEALDVLEGPAGSSIVLTVQRGRQRLTLVMTRSVGATSFAVIVQLRAWPNASVMEPFAAQSPVIESV